MAVMIRISRCIVHSMLAVSVLSIAPAAQAGGGPLGIDHRLTYDDSGIWARSNQQALLGAMLVAEVSGALWEGGETRLGRTLWQSIDATLVSGLSSEALKRVFSRKRPIDSSDPNEWFTGHGNQSFPSGEVTVTSAIVTPLVLTYGHEHPAVYALELLPLYDAVARMKVQAHWQTDVIAGFALGTAAGYFMQRRQESPIVLSVMPHGVFIGLKKQW